MQFEGQGIFLVLNNGSVKRKLYGVVQENEPFISMQIGWWVENYSEYEDYRFYGVDVTMKVSGEITKMEYGTAGLVREKFDQGLYVCFGMNSDGYMLKMKKSKQNSGIQEQWWSSSYTSFTVDHSKTS